MNASLIEIAELKAASAKEPATVQEVIEWSKTHPLRWFMPNLILEEGVHILHGHEESFKTMLMLQLHEALTVGGQFLAWNAEGGLRTGIAELEMKMQMSGSRLGNFWKSSDVPEIYMLPESSRRKVLAGKTAGDRINVIVEWATANELEFVSIDSLAKLFPAGHDPSRQDFASDVFSNIQLLRTVLILAHDRKSHDSKGAASTGNAEIVGSGRMAQEPDVVHQVIRPDKRAPMIELTCGKMREGVKPEPLKAFFDREDFRLHPYHPFLHLLPASEPELIEEAHKRYGWKERHARDHIKTLAQLPGIDAAQSAPNRPKFLSSHMTVSELGAALDNQDVPESAAVLAASSVSPGT
jgi:hypothetical protein